VVGGVPFGNIKWACCKFIFWKYFWGVWVVVLKIALILETSGGGSGRHVTDLAKTLCEYGHQVTIFWSPMRAEDSFCDALNALKHAKNVPVRLRRSVGVHDVTGLIQLKAAIQREGPFDVLHAHSSKAGALVRILPRRIGGLRVYTPHALRTMDPDISARASRVYGLIERVLSWWADPIIAVSVAEQQHAIQLGIRPHQVNVVANGASPKLGLSRHEARAAFGVGESKVVVGFVGRMVPQKDPLRFVEALRLATAQVPNLHGVMMGDGPLLDQARALAGDAPCTFMGWCDAPAMIHGLDVLCVTSRYEALAYSFLEALHAEVPIISTSVGGVEETVLDDQTGFIVPTDATSEMIAEKMVALARDGDKRRAFACASSKLAKQRTLECMTSATLDIYQMSGTTVERVA